MNTKHWTSTWHVRALFHPEPPQGTGNGLGLLRAVVLALILALGVLPVPSAQAAGGDVDPTFIADPNDEVWAVAVQSDGKVLIGGDFTQVNGFVNGVVRNHIARLNADGSVDTTFMNGLAGTVFPVFAVAVQSDGKVLIGGDFQYVNDVARHGIARLNADGTIDTTFMDGLAGANGEVWAVPVQSDGKVLIGGRFTRVNGVTRNRIARLNADGSLDTTFMNGLTGVTEANSYVLAVTLQSDGKVLIGGVFTQVNGVTRICLARLLPSSNESKLYLPLVLRQP